MHWPSLPVDEMKELFPVMINTVGLLEGAPVGMCEGDLVGASDAGDETAATASTDPSHSTRLYTSCP